MSTILIVDDSAEIRELLVETLDAPSHVIMTAADAAAGLREIERRPVDLLITDIRLPGGVNGFELARKAKAMRAGIRVIYISGFFNPEEASEEALFGTLIRKPFKPTDLLTAIAGTVKR